MQHTTQSICDHVNGKLVGNGDLSIERLAMIDSAQTGDLTFVGEKRYASRWPESSATAALINENIELEPGDGKALIFVENADLAMAKVLELFAEPPIQPELGVHPTAIIDDSATVGDGVRIGAFCVIGKGVSVGANTVLHPRVTLHDDVSVGDRCVFWPGVVIRERCVVGSDCVMEPNVVIGADGFGYRPDHSGDVPRIVKIPHIGNVIIGDAVELGAATTIDRGKFGATTIGSGTKIDNQVQIGHNCNVGRLVIISGSSAVGGSTTIGDGVMIGGATIIRDHITIGPGAKLGGGTGAMDDIPAGVSVVGFPAMPSKQMFRREAAIRQLPDLMKKVKRLLSTDNM